MFYDAIANDHGLRHDPFKALVVPRPIGWISSLARDGTVNLAPYSYFNAVGSNPHYVLFSSGGYKHSAANIAATKEFVCNLATWDLREQMNLTSAPLPAGVDEMRIAGLTPAPCRLVRPPRVAESPVALECVYTQTLELPADDPDEPNVIIIGKVVGIHIEDAFIRDGLVDAAAMKPIARCGYMDYAVVTEMFSMRRPSAAEAQALLARQTKPAAE
ncbi:flavin reductase family protein [Rhodoligotrophos defluvii]|uniref:flavin reductase family protein n=1 Tax=Rhodoligotrophos defluvii TaxID=2561934 RepID=UPI0010C98C20|nr:flavin reductase family protein [Rhodoligotrophos defluvii]